MLDSRCVRPRDPLDDSWLFADPMTIALEGGTRDDGSTENVASDTDGVAARVPVVGWIVDGLGPGAPSRGTGGALWQHHGLSKLAEHGTLRRRWICVVGAIALAAGVVLGQWRAMPSIDPQMAVNGPAVVKTRCGDGAETTTSSRTL